LLHLRRGDFDLRAAAFFSVSGMCGAFVGAGLVFAGVTDWCGMGLLLAKMPWNQQSGCASGSCCEVKH
jgi:uncharacterized membrane protein YfcA